MRQPWRGPSLVISWWCLWHSADRHRYGNAQGTRRRISRLRAAITGVVRRIMSPAGVCAHSASPVSSTGMISFCGDRSAANADSSAGTDTTWSSVSKTPARAAPTLSSLCRVPGLPHVIRLDQCFRGVTRRPVQRLLLVIRLPRARLGLRLFAVAAGHRVGDPHCFRVGGCEVWPL